MATIQELVNHPDVSPHFRMRYSTAIPGTTIIPFVQWANDLLEELQERGFLSTLIKETGVVVDKHKWLSKPSDFFSLIKVFNPKEDKEEYRVEGVQDKFKLVDWEMEAESGSIDTDAYDGYLTTGINCTDLTSTVYGTDHFENWLFFIESGTLANTGLIVDSNVAAALTGTVLTFLHPLSAALSGTKVTGARLIDPAYYVMMKYNALITEVTALADEMPIPDDCEFRLVPAWFRWKCERAAMATSKEAMYWEGQVNKIIYSIQASRLGRMITPATGRRLVGMERNVGYNSKSHPGYSEF